VPQAKRPRKSRDMVTIHPAAAAIDIGATIHVAAVGPERDNEPVRTFRTFTDDLHRLADWFAGCGIKTVVMESTGVYWIPIFEILEQRGFEVMVVNAGTRSMYRAARPTSATHNGYSVSTNMACCVPASGLRPKLPVCAPISGSGAAAGLCGGTHPAYAKGTDADEPATASCRVRYYRVTGMSIIRAIVEGERDPNVLASHRERGCHSSVETMCQALVGNYREEHVFALTQALELYDVYQTKVTACDKQIQAILMRLKQTAPSPANKLLPVRRRSRQPNAPAFDARAALHAILGVDLTRIDAWDHTSR